MTILAIIGVALCTAEMFVPGLFVLPIGVGFLLTAPIAKWVAAPGIYFVLGINMLVSFLIFQKWVKPRFNRPHTKSNVDALIGQKAHVIETINFETGTGYVKVYADEWRAISSDQSVIQKGSWVKILKMEGNTVTVSPV